jgi:hypothetical protein
VVILFIADLLAHRGRQGQNPMPQRLAELLPHRWREIDDWNWWNYFFEQLPLRSDLSLRHPDFPPALFAHSRKGT